MSTRTSREEQLFADALARPEQKNAALPLHAPDGYSFGMPHSPAAMSRRFISGVTGTAPIDFSHRRKAGKVFGAFFNVADGARRTRCLIRVVFVAGFEMVDGMLQCCVETQVRQPNFFAQISAGGEQVLMSDSVGRVETGKNVIAAFGATHQPHHKRHHLPLHRGELHCDVTPLVQPDDEGFLTHAADESVEFRESPAHSRRHTRMQRIDRSLS